MGAFLRDETASLRVTTQPFRRVYSGVGPVDRHLQRLVGFFTALLDDPGAGWESSALLFWGLAQMGGVWTLIMLESLRSGSRGRLVSWAGTVGFIFQNITFAVAVPLYLALHLLTSPVASLGSSDRNAARRALFVYLWDLAVLTSAVTLGFIAPTLLMALRDPMGHDAATHYKWIAIWQLFPVWTAVAQWVAHRAGYYLLGSMVPRDDDGRPTTPGVAFSVAVSGVYEFVLTLCVATQLPVLTLVALPSPARSFLASAFPALAPILEQVTFARTFVPNPPGAPPSPGLDYAPGELAAPVVDFLQWDFYVGSVPLLLWAVYLHQTTVRNPGPVALLRKIGYWFVVGGPVAATAALLWERDEVVKEDEAPLKDKDT